MQPKMDKKPQKRNAKPKKHKNSPTKGEKHAPKKTAEPLKNSTKFAKKKTRSRSGGDKVNSSKSKACDDSIQEKLQKNIENIRSNTRVSINKIVCGSSYTSSGEVEKLKDEIRMNRTCTSLSWFDVQAVKDIQEEIASYREDMARTARQLEEKIPTIEDIENSPQVDLLKCTRSNNYKHPSNKMENLSSFVKEAEDAIQEMKMCLEKYCACKCKSNVCSPNNTDVLRSDTETEQNLLSYIEKPLEETPRVLCGSCSDSHLKTISEKTEICETISTPSIILDIHLKTPECKTTVEGTSDESDFEKAVEDTVASCDCEVEEDKIGYDSEEKAPSLPLTTKLSITQKNNKVVTEETLVQSCTNCPKKSVENKLNKLTVHNMPLIDIQRDLVIQNVLKIDIQGIPHKKKQISNVGYVEYKFLRSLEKSSQYTDSGESNKDKRKARLEQSRVQLNNINLSVSKHCKVDLKDTVPEKNKASKMPPLCECSTTKETADFTSQSPEREPTTNSNNIDAQIEKVNNIIEEITLDQKQETVDEEKKVVQQDKGQPVKSTGELPVKSVTQDKLSIRPTEVWVVPSKPPEKCWCFNDIVGITCKCSSNEVTNKNNVLAEPEETKNVVLEDYENLVIATKPRPSMHPVRRRTRTSDDIKQLNHSKSTSTEKVVYLDAEANTVNPTATAESSTQTISPEQSSKEQSFSESGEYILVHDVSAQTSFEYIDNSSGEKTINGLDIFATTKFEKIPSKPALTLGELSNIRSESKAFFTHLLGKKSTHSSKHKTSLKDSKSDNKMFEDSSAAEQPMQVINLLEPQVLTTSVTEEPSSLRSSSDMKKKELVPVEKSSVKNSPLQVDTSGDNLSIAERQPKAESKTKKKSPKSSKAPKRLFRSSKTEESLSDGETLCRCSISSGEVHKCPARKCKCSLKRHARPNFYGNYRIAREHYHSQNFVSYYISKSTSQV